MLICFDGGGSTSRMLLIDDDYNLIGEGIAPGVNTNHTPLPIVRNNIRECLLQALGTYKLSDIDEAVITVVGPAKEFTDLLDIDNDKIQMINEPCAALLAGILCESGYVALSGTGSGVFYVDDTKECAASLGGLGIILGDEGSGAWIGQHALRAVAAHLQGCGPATVLTKYAREFFGIEGARDIVNNLYASSSYVRYIASFVPEAAKAANKDDDIALALFKQAGEFLAGQLVLLISRTDVQNSNKTCVISGGVWKAHPVMLEAFKSSVYTTHPEINIRKPYFEPVMAGVVQKYKRQNPGVPDAKCVEFLSKKFLDYTLRF